MTILVDIDSTITNFSETLLDCLNVEYGTNHEYDEIDHYGWFDDTFFNPWRITNNTRFWDRIAVNPVAIQVIENWIKEGHKVYLVTASSYNQMLGYKINKTVENFNHLLLDSKNVIVAHNKNMIKGDLLIDDSEANLANFDGKTICYAQPWNKDYQGKRTDSWFMIEHMVDYD